MPSKASDPEARHILIGLLLLISLTACGGASAPGSFRCNEKVGVCVKLTAEEPIIVGEPVVLTITVTSEKDVSDLPISLFSIDPVKVFIEEPNSQEWKERQSDWTISVQADQPLQITRKIQLPAEKDALYSIVVQVFLPSIGGMVADTLTIVISGGSGTVYYSGTKIPGVEAFMQVTVDGYTTAPAPTSYPAVTEQFIPVSPVAITITPLP